MMQHHGYSLTELENMMPWEREIYVTLLMPHIKEENEKNKLANTVYLFTDGSVNTTTKIGVGGYLICSEISNNLLESDVVLKTFQNTSSTKLELQTFLWAIRQVNHERKNVIAFSDSQNLISLIEALSPISTS